MWNSLESPAMKLIPHLGGSGLRKKKKKTTVDELCVFACQPLCKHLNNICRVMFSFLHLVLIRYHLLRTAGKPGTSIKPLIPKIMLMRWLEWLFPRIASPLEGCSGLSPLSRLSAWTRSHHAPVAVLLKGHPTGQHRHREDFFIQTGSQGQQLPGRLQRKWKMCEPQRKGRCEVPELGWECSCGRDSSYSGGNWRK